MTITHIWVKGHQDTTKIGKIFGPFSREVQLNIEMDTVTSAGCRIPAWQRPIYLHTKMGIYDANGVIASDIDTLMYEHINGKIQKYGWEADTMTMIMWNALGDALRLYSKCKQKVVHLLYDWQMTDHKIHYDRRVAYV